MAQASLRLGRSVAAAARLGCRRNLATSSALAGKHVNYAVQDGVAILT